MHEQSRASVVRGLPKQKFANTAFTLAEVLITLAIIGVVAALTIPTVINNYQERATITQLKKFYSTINQAYQMMQITEGTPDTWDWGTYDSSASANVILQKMAPYLKIIKNCGITSTDCFYNGNYKTLNPSVNWLNTNPNSHFYARATLADGSSMFVWTAGGKCTTNRGNSKALKSTCGAIGVDLNGTKSPNRWGVDTFYFYATKYGVIPFGTKDDTKYCIKSSGCTYNSNCLSSDTTGYNGPACTAWILSKDNMDYLRRDIRDEW